MQAALSEIEVALQGSDLTRAASRLLDIKNSHSIPKSITSSIIIINQQHSELRHELRNGTIPLDEYRLEMSRLTQRILSTCTEIRQFADTQDARKDASPAAGANNSSLLHTQVSHPPAKPLVILKNVNHEVTGFRLYIGNLEITPGHMVGVVGPNASGKTTLLRIAAGDLSPSYGAAGYPGLGFARRDWYTIKQKIGYVRQNPGPWPGLVIDNLRFEAAAHGHYRRQNEMWVSQWTERLRLGEHVHKAWYELSAGLKARFELVRVLIRSAPLLVLDEPLAPLDPPMQILFLWDLRKFCQDCGIGVILSSQHLHEVEAFCDSVIFLQNGQPVALAPDGATHVEVAFDAPQGVAHDVALSIDPHYRFDGYVFTFCVRSGLSDVLARLQRPEVRVTYIRDITHSYKRLLV
jgi:ABC-2 type transport system ATP-binding protein